MQNKTKPRIIQKQNKPTYNTEENQIAYVKEKVRDSQMAIRNHLELKDLFYIQSKQRKKFLRKRN